MKRFVMYAVLVACFASPHWMVAQTSDHIEIGAFADYFRMDRTDPNLNFVGLGGRVGFNLNAYAQIEGEMAYDFNKSYVNTFENGGSIQLVDSRTHILHALFGPKLQTGSGPFRVFVTGKVGLINFSTNSQGVESGFKSALGAVGNGNAKFALYPGGGVEGFAGPIGVRLEVGDDIYFDNGARNNFRATFGPVFRF